MRKRIHALTALAIHPVATPAADSHGGVEQAQQAQQGEQGQQGAATPDAAGRDQQAGLGEIGPIPVAQPERKPHSRRPPGGSLSAMQWARHVGNEAVEGIKTFAVRVSSCAQCMQMHGALVSASRRLARSEMSSKTATWLTSRRAIRAHLRGRLERTRGRVLAQRRRAGGSPRGGSARLELPLACQVSSQCALKSMAASGRDRRVYRRPIAGNGWAAAEPRSAPV